MFDRAETPIIGTCIIGGINRQGGYSNLERGPSPPLNVAYDRYTPEKGRTV